MMRGIICIVCLILLLPTAAAFEDFLEVVVELDSSGNAFISYFPSIDTTERSNITISVPLGSYFKVYDDNDSLSFTSEHNMLTVIPAEKNPAYLFVLEFFTSELTIKQAEYWIANYSSFDGFNNIVFRMKMPEYSKVFEIYPEGTIVYDGDRLAVEWTFTEEPNYLFINYSLLIKNNKLTEEAAPENRGIYLGGLILLLVIILTSLFLLLSYRKKVVNPEVLNGLPKRQIEIIKLLREKGGKMTQNTLMERLSLPKSSLSRNLKALQKKEMITIMNLGNTNLISLKNGDD